MYIKSKGKIAIDYLGSAVLLAIAIIPFAIIAYAVKRDGGPAVFKHERIGEGGRKFGCLKFRTMIVDPNGEVLRSILENDPEAKAEWEANQKLKNDPRITKLGLFLRRTSLDELPQLINILLGHMSLVGPRPIVESEISKYGEHIDHYLAARPGMTGLWQVSGRSDTSYEERVKLDVKYVKEWSLKRDIIILFKTAHVVFIRKGAV